MFGHGICALSYSHHSPGSAIYLARVKPRAQHLNQYHYGVVCGGGSRVKPHSVNVGCNGGGMRLCWFVLSSGLTYDRFVWKLANNRALLTSRDFGRGAYSQGMSSTSSAPSWIARGCLDGGLMTHLSRPKDMALVAPLAITQNEERLDHHHGV